MTGKVGAAVLLAATTLVATAGCARVDLVNEWPALAEPTGWEPKAGACTSNFAETSYRSAYKVDDCAGPHLYETVYIGQFKGDAATADKPPAPGSAAVLAAWGECDAKTTEFVGAEWRTAWIWISVSVPSSGNWEGGARWFRCEVGETNQELASRASRSKSLKGELTGDSRLKLGCSQHDENQGSEEKPCTEAHNSEFVGVFTSNDSWDDLNKNPESVHQKCRSLIAAYAGVPDDGNMKYRTGTWYFVVNKREWDAGDHGVRCHMWMGDKKFTRSIKDGGTKVLPINYA